MRYPAAPPFCGACMKRYVTLTVLGLLLLASCSVGSAIRSGARTVYKTAVDERSIKHILNDKKLTALLMEEILADDVTMVLDVSAKCYYGYPFIVGQCDTLAEAERLVAIAREVTGKPPVPYILKKGDERFCTLADNLRITTELNARLVADSAVFSTNIFVKSVQCHAVLLGVVSSDRAMQAAEYHARHTPGVKKVRSFLVATGTGRSWEAVMDAIAEMTMKEDEELITEDQPEALDPLPPVMVPEETAPPVP
ncbi:hyperosmotically inducible protein [Desulfoluna spongiiphila]|uniref:Hyperosmotically inducible protein n=2 Tax=Desulfoluna spongiiphila TaxID=419481 RepID=A0A1G5E8V4_9BACT|nr:hyperosmotically inducible protein [Desulfoluna spongiiphila]